MQHKFEKADGRQGIGRIHEHVHGDGPPPPGQKNVTYSWEIRPDYPADAPFLTGSGYDSVPQAQSAMRAYMDAWSKMFGQYASGDY